MMKQIKKITGMLLLGLVLPASCTKEQPAPSIQADGSGTHKVSLNFDISGSGGTKARNSSEIPLDSARRLDLYMFFDKEPELNYHHTIIPESKKDCTYEIEAKQNETVGVLVFANLDEDTAEHFDGASLEDLYNVSSSDKKIVLEAGNFDYDRIPMIGSGYYQFSQDGSQTINLHRIMTRIELENIEVAFENESLIGKEVKVKNIAITNVMNTFTPLYAKHLGDFQYTTYLYFGSISYTLSSAFGGVTKGFTYTRNNVGTYHKDSLTVNGPGKLNGKFPYEYNVNYRPAEGGFNLDYDGPLAEMTIQHYDTDAGEGLIVQDGDMTSSHTFNVGKCFYTLFWSAGSFGHLTCDVGSDMNSLKLVTELSIDGKTYFYPIELEYLQPNYVYKISKITIKNIGSEYSNFNVKKYKCDFTVTIKPWTDVDVTNLNVGVDPETGEPVDAYDS